MNPRNVGEIENAEAVGELDPKWEYYENILKNK